MNGGDFAPWQPQYGSTQNRHNTQIVLLPAPYRGASAWSQPASYHYVQPRPDLPTHSLQVPHLQTRNLQAQGLQQVVQVQGPQSFEVQNLVEMSHSGPLPQSQISTQAVQSAPVYPSIEGILFPTNDAKEGTEPESFDIDMPLLPDRARDETSADVAMRTTSDASDALCCSCGGHKDWKRLVSASNRASLSGG